MDLIVFGFSMGDCIELLTWSGTSFHYCWSRDWRFLCSFVCCSGGWCSATRSNLPFWWSFDVRWSWSNRLRSICLWMIAEPHYNSHLPFILYIYRNIDAYLVLLSSFGCFVSVVNSFVGFHDVILRSFLDCHAVNYSFHRLLILE